MMPQLSSQFALQKADARRPVPQPVRQAVTRRRQPASLAVAVIVGALALGACGQDDRRAASDSLLSRDLTLAASATTVAPPLALGDTAASQAATSAPPVARNEAPAATPERRPAARPSRPAPRPPAAPAPAPVTEPVVSEPIPSPPSSAPAASPTTPARSETEGTAGSGAGRRAIGAGTGLVGTTNAAICSLANRPGDRLVANLSNEVIGPDGARLAVGTPILVEMAAPATPGDFAFRVKAVQVNGVLIPVEGTVAVSGETTERRVSQGGDKGKVIGGAIAGAILGRVLGGGAKGTVIGAAGGAAAGTVAASRNSVTEKCLPAGATLTVTLSAPLLLSPGSQ